MSYFIFISLCIIAIGISIFAIKWGIKDATSISKKEIDNLSPGDRITIKLTNKEYHTGRIIFINKTTGCGVINTKNHGTKSFHTTNVRSLS
jgi:TusA-related sulfurtransferase